MMMRQGRVGGVGNGGASFWQRRYLLRHYRRFDDRELATAAGLSVGTVAAFLKSQGALRSPSDLRRIAESHDPPPAILSPTVVRTRLTQLESRPLVALDWLLIATMLVGSLVLYGATAALTVTGEDGGELLAAAHGFGVPHPPGYPLWLLLAWAADHALPFGTVALRVTAASFVFSALANALFLAVALKTIRSRLAACAGVALFAVSLTHWTQAVIPEVYGLNIFFFALCALLLVRFGERPTAGRLLALAFVAGLACTNHTTAVPVAAMLLVLAILRAPELFKRPGLVALVLLAGLLPNALYLILPVISRTDPYIDWGNPESLPALWEHMARTQYSGMEVEHRVESRYADYLRRLGNLRDWGLRQFSSGWMLLLPALGFFPLAFRQTGLWLFLTVSAYFCTIGVTRYMAYDFGKEHLYAVTMFWIPPAMTLAWYAAGAIDVLLAGLRHLLRAAQPSVGRLATASAALGLVALIAFPAAKNHHITDRSGTTLVRDFGHSILQVMEPGALYFPSSDHSTFSVLYWQGVEGYRPDVTIADKYGRIERAIFERFLDHDERAQLDSLPGTERRAFIETVLIRKWPGPVYFANRRDMKDVPEVSLEPVGPIFRVMTPGEATAWWGADDGGSLPPGLALWERLSPLIDVPLVQRVDLTVQMLRGDLLYMRGFAQLRAGRLEDAIASWEAIDGDLAPLKQTFNNCASALAEHDRTAEALRFYERALEEDPRYALALRNKSVVHSTRHEWSAAIRTLQSLRDVDPKNRDARLRLAQLLGEQDRVIEALAEYEALAAAEPRDPQPWIDGGRLLQRVGDGGKAEAAYVEALRLDPSRQDIAEALARVRQGVELLTAGRPDLSADIHDHEGAVPPAAPGPWVSGLPADPTQGLLFDPMRGPPQPPVHR